MPQNSSKKDSKGRSVRGVASDVKPLLPVASSFEETRSSLYQSYIFCNALAISIHQYARYEKF
jgi:hypothetical protein